LTKGIGLLYLKGGKERGRHKKEKAQNNYLFTTGELNDRSMKLITFLRLEPKLRMRGAVPPFAHTTLYCDFPFPLSFNDILNFSGYAESKSKLIVEQ
jgi:hypothetical protein